MSEKPVIEIFCNGNKKIGLGHIRRSAALAAQLEEDGVHVQMIGLTPFTQAFLPEPKFTVANAKAKLYVFDSLTGIDQHIERAKKERKITVTLDWFGDTEPDVNIVVYPHKEVKAVKQNFIGFEYIIIRNEIVELGQPAASGKWNKVLVCLGGGDLLKQGLAAAQLLHDNGLDVTLVQGPLADDLTGNGEFPIFIDPPNFPQLLASCDLAVTNGGGCFFEAMCLGKPAFVLPQTELEWRIAEFAAAKKSVLGTGINGLINYQSAQFEQVARDGARLVDGKGLERVVTIIKNLL